MAQPGMRIVTASSPQAAYEMLRAAIRNNDPVLFYEHKVAVSPQGPRPAGRHRGHRHRARGARRHGRDHPRRPCSWSSDRSLPPKRWPPRASAPRSSTCAGSGPSTMPTIEASVRKTGRLVVAEEQWHEGGWGATVITKLAQTRIPWKASPTAVSLPYDLLIPYSPPLEDELMPSADKHRGRGTDPGRSMTTPTVGPAGNARVEQHATRPELAAHRAHRDHRAAGAARPAVRRQRVLDDQPDDHHHPPVHHGRPRVGGLQRRHGR